MRDMKWKKCFWSKLQKSYEKYQMDQFLVWLVLSEECSIVAEKGETVVKKNGGTFKAGPLEAILVVEP